MSIFRDSFVKESPIFTGISRGVGGFGYGASGAGDGGAPTHTDHISGLSGDGTKIVTDGVTFYQANHNISLNNPSTAPSFQFTTAQPFYIAMIGASGNRGYNSALPGCGGIGVALVTPNASTTYRVWSGVGGYWSTNNTSSHEKSAYRGGAGGIGNQSGLSNTYRIQGGGGGAGALIRGTGGLTSSTNLLAMVGSGGSSGNGGGEGAGHGGGFNRDGVTKSSNTTANGQGATTSSAGDGGTWSSGYADAGNGGGFMNGGQGGNSNYDAGGGGGNGWYGGGGGSGGGGFSGGAGGGGSGKTQNISGDTVDLSSPLTNTADGSSTGNATLQTWIRAASGVQYVIPNANYGQSPSSHGAGYAGWACVWSYHAL